MIYLDNAASTKMSDDVVSVMKYYLDAGLYGNPDSRHCVGFPLSNMVENARRQVADAIGADPECVYFTSGGTEGNTTVINGFDNRGIVTSSVEHSSVYEAVNTRKPHKFISVDRGGELNYDELKDVTGIGTGLVSIMAVNNEVGTANDISRIVKMAHSKKALVHIDYVQAFGQYPINVKELNVDFLTISSHKVHGPQGVGAIYVKDKSTIVPLLAGSPTQGGGVRPGTKNVLGIIGFGEACNHIAEAKVDPRLSSMFKSKLYEECVKYFGAEVYDIIQINGKPNPKILNLTFRGVDAETLILMLSSRGICVSAGSACHAGETKPSRVLKAMGLSDEEAMSSIRVSFSSMNTASDMETAATNIAACVKTIRG